MLWHWSKRMNFLSALGVLVAWCLGHQANGSHRAEQVPLCFQLFSGWIILSILLWNWSNKMTILSALGVLMVRCKGTRTSAATELSLYPEVTSWLGRSNHAECDSATIKLIFLSSLGRWCNNRTYTSSVYSNWLLNPVLITCLYDKARWVYIDTRQLVIPTSHFWNWSNPELTFFC